MRRISLAVALVSAVAATGCGGNVSPNSGTGKGVKDGTFKVTVQNTAPLAITGGVITSTPAGINCGSGNTACEYSFPLGTAVSLTATPNATPSGNMFLGWAGSCYDVGACSLSGNSDKYLVAMFGTEYTGHANEADPAKHAKSYLDFVSGVAGARQCTSCHGSSLEGSGLALACSTCHAWPIGKHFEAAGHNSGTCARCHAGDGFRDFIGADGSASAVGTEGYLSTSPAATDKTKAICTGTNIPTGCTTDPALGLVSGMKCDMCHNAVTEPIGAAGTWAKTKLFPSGKTLTLDSSSALCAQCHDGGRPGYNIAQLNLVLSDASNVALAPDAQLVVSNGVVRAHYLPAASTLYGAEAANWYQFPAGTEPYIYTQRNEHAGKNSCSFCHNPHTGALPSDAEIVTKCGGCHADEVTGQPVRTFLQLEESRQFGFGEVDVDGNGAVESLRTEINGLGGKLYSAIQAYATNVAGASLCIADNKAFLQADPALACGVAPNAVAYNKFTPRLLKAVYNYLMFQNDLGSWAHNPRYTIEVLFDTITDVNSGLGTNAIVFNGFRGFEGHFGGVSAAAPAGSAVFHDWDAAPTTVGTACAQCHAGANGMDKYFGLTGNVAMPATPAISPVPAFECATCHATAETDNDMKRIRTVANVYMPGQKGAVTGQTFVTLTAADFDNAKDMICASCHSGRENKNSIDVKIGVKLPNDWSIGFTNPHYLGAAGVMFGAKTHMMYEYSGKTYVTDPINKGSPHGSPHGASCNGCHQPVASKHSFEADLTYCGGCHVQKSYGDFRLAPLKDNVNALAAQLYGTIQAYAKAAALDTVANPGAAAVCYNGGAYPYWFKDTNGDGTCDVVESVSANGAKFNAAASKAAFNYKWSQAEPGAYAHNYEYMAQALIDSILDLDPAAVLPIDAKTGVAIVRP